MCGVWFAWGVLLPRQIVARRRLQRLGLGAGAARATRTFEANKLRRRARVARVRGNRKQCRDATDSIFPSPRVANLSQVALHLTRIDAEEPRACARGDRR